MQNSEKDNTYNLKTPLGDIKATWDTGDVSKKAGISFDFKMPQKLFGFDIENTIKNSLGNYATEQIYKGAKITADAEYTPNSEESIDKTTVSFNGGNMHIAAGEIVDLNLSLSKINSRLKYGKRMLSFNAGAKRHNSI